MWEPRPTLAFTETIRGHGHLCRGNARVPVAMVTLERAKYAYEEPWALSGVIGVDSQHDARSLLYRDTSGPAWLEGETDLGVPFYVRDLKLANIRDRRLTNRVHKFELGPAELPEIPPTQSVIVYLSQTPLAMSQERLRALGELGAQHDAGAREPFRWTSALGVFRLERVDDYEDADVSGLPATVSVPIALLGCEVDVSARSTRPMDMIHALTEELRPFLAVLSLLSRGHVHWTKVEVQSWDREFPETADWGR
jgi:hypothetical protein